MKRERTPAPPPQVPAAPGWGWELALCLLPAALALAVFGPAVHFEFVNLDDPAYVYANPVVLAGVTLKGCVWAFTSVQAFNWHPLTWLSHMLDCQFYGLWAGGHHLTSVLLHMATASLLFLVLRQMTGVLWRSLFVAAVFAIHPLRAESVAWVAERKDVLSGLFFVLTLGAYVWYARRAWSLGRYGLVVLLFALGLLCKPMLVTLPVVLLLLDYWPLDRWRRDGAGEAVFRVAGRRLPRRLVLEKLPLFGLAAASSAVTLFAQTDAIQSIANFPLAWRAGNAVIACTAYLGQMFWPVGLAAFYPFPRGGMAVSDVLLSVVLLAGISAAVLVLRRRPYLLAGWLWYLVMLTPVSGIFQVGSQARADRYTYLPQIGLCVALTWAVADLSVRWRYRRTLLGVLMAGVVATLAVGASTQASYWQNNESLWTRTLAVTTDNSLAHYYLGFTLAEQGRTGAAIAHYEQALHLQPDYFDAHNNLGNALAQQGRFAEAIPHYQKALELQPNCVGTHNNLGNALAQQGRLPEAMAHYEEALRLDPGYANAHNNEGNVLAQQGRLTGAIAHYKEALRLDPNCAGARIHLDKALAQQRRLAEALAQCEKLLQQNPLSAETHESLGSLLAEERPAEAVMHMEKALALNPDRPSALNNLAWLLATCRDASVRQTARALELAQRANTLTGNKDPIVLDTLAAAYAGAGDFPQAVATARRALALAAVQGNASLVSSLRSAIPRYEAHKPVW